MALSYIEVKNFQAHENTRVELHPGMNVFIGESNVGKTAIMRAEELVRTNRPNDPSKISKWARKRNKAGNIQIMDRMEITIGTPSHTITRFRDSKENGYSVDGLPLKAVGRSVPDEVTSALNLTDVNIAKQHDPHFFLSWSSPDISKYLNDLCGMDILDKCQQFANARKREAKDNMDRLETDCKIISESLAKLDWVENAQAIFEKVEQEFILANQKYGYSKAILQTVSDIGIALNEVKRLGYIDNAVSMLSNAKSESGKADMAWRKYSSIHKDLKAATEAKAVLDRTSFISQAREKLRYAAFELEQQKMVEHKLNSIRALIETILKAKKALDFHIDTDKATGFLNEAKKHQRRAKAAREDLQSIQGLIIQANAHKDAIEKHDASIAKYQLELVALKERQKQESKKCDKCGQPWPKHMEHK